MTVAFLIDGTEYGAELKTKVSSLWLRTALAAQVDIVRPSTGFGVTAIVDVIEEAGPGDCYVAYPDLCDTRWKTIIMYLQGLAALVTPAVIVLAPLVEAGCTSMQDVVKLGLANGLSDEEMQKCRDYPKSDTTSKSPAKTTLNRSV